MNKRIYFLKIFKKAEKKYGKSTKRLAGEGWKKPWQTLIVTILSAQSRDETTIPIAERLFKKYPTLDKLSKASIKSIEKALKGMNYYKTKARNIKKASQMLLKEYKGKVPNTIEELTKLPGVGRKTANLILIQHHEKDAICVDTHVHRISNILGLVKTKTREQTEEELKKISPRKYWSRINRIFVLWGKEVPGRDKKRLLRKLEE